MRVTSRDGETAGRSSADPLADALHHLRVHWPHVDRRTVWASGNLLRAHDLVLAKLDDTVRGTGVTFARLEFLLMLYYSRAGALPLGRISERLMIHRASVTGAIDRLEDLGLVVRTRPEGDRRTVLAEITPAGRKAVEDSVPVLVEARFGLDGLTDDELVEFARLLGKLRRVHGDPVGEPDLDG